MASRFLIIALITASAITDVCARKVRQSLKVDVPVKTRGSLGDCDTITRIEVDASATYSFLLPDGSESVFHPDSISFAGYDKDANASAETFFVVNNGSKCIAGFKVKIIYRDMKGRMLHSRDTTVIISVPPHESRKVDVATWDRQHSFYYYLGNVPRKVATPYKVEFIPMSFYLECNTESI